jgi:hypothetical protein
MTNQNQKINEILDQEIAFHIDTKNLWYWRWICSLFGKPECHVILTNELRFLKKCLEPKSIRYCADCGEPFEPEDATDWWCKKHLLKQYQDNRPKPVIKSVSKEPELTDSSPGGS